MIPPQQLRRLSRQLNLGLDMVEKDYVLGWILFAMMSSSVSNRLAFKGGTSLSKVYFPGKWRLSEDLDFTVIGEEDWQDISTAIKEEVPKLVSDNIWIQVKKKIYSNPNYLQAKTQYVGPIGPGRIRIELSREEVVEPLVTKQVPVAFDYPKFSVRVYSLENILAEKLRSLLQRGKIRDYYDVWRLLKEKRVRNNIAELFKKKCESKGVMFDGIEQFFPDGIEEALKPHVPNLTRLTGESLEINKMLSEMRKSIPDVL